MIILALSSLLKKWLDLRALFVLALVEFVSLDIFALAFLYSWI